MVPSRIKENWNNALVSLAALLVFLAAAELGLRGIYAIRASMIEQVALPYMHGDLYGPLPPWWDKQRILETDASLIWKGRANVQQTYIDVFRPVWREEDRRVQLRAFFPSIPDSLRKSPAWQISLNSQGFRDQEFVKHKPPSVFRIICLGDSWTFGSNVGQDQTYPQQLQRLLQQKFPPASFQVLNMGVMGHSSFQGLELLRRRALELNPDLLVIGYAMNDSSVAGFRDKDMPGYGASLSLSRWLGNFIAKHSEICKLLRYFALVLKDKPKSLTQILESTLASADNGSELLEHRMTEASVYAKVEPWTRVSMLDYEQNLRGMIELARSHGVGVILLYNEIWESSPYMALLNKLAKATKVPLVNSSAIVSEARSNIEGKLERDLDLYPVDPHSFNDRGASESPPAKGSVMPHGDHEVEVVFRVYAGSYPVPERLYIAGTHQKLGSSIPNTIAMYDDGTHGDQKAGDHVWSYAATFPPGTAVFYVYTNSGREGQWEGLDVPHVRGFKVDAADAGKTVYRQIETFGEIYMQADSWHTNALGYELIAKAVLRILEREERVVAYLDRLQQGRWDTETAVRGAFRAIASKRALALDGNTSQRLTYSPSEI